ncbi:hypothetical protein MBLNU230_g3581t1 [Neophaeotheca triangularis]
MYPQASGPGKTSPRLYHDFISLDPLKSTKYNVLADPAPEYQGIIPAPPADSCKHDYTYKPNQSITPPLDLRPDGTTFYRLAVVCKKCRLHADIRIDYSQATDPCPNASHPLHHFQRLDSLDVQSVALLRFGWQCSNQACNAILTVSYRQKRLQDAEVNHLTNKSLLRKRYEQLIEGEPEREGMREAKDWEALQRLRKYIKDALNPEHMRRSFPGNNKRFMEAFGAYGEDCRTLLEGLGFTYAPDDLHWSLPQPPLIQDRKSADASSQRELLEDVEVELAALLNDFTKAAGAINPAAAEGWPSALQEIERTLAAQGYQRASNTRSRNASDREKPYYASLGALSDFSDTLVDFAHERQTNCDPAQQAYYLECLQEITSARGSEQLHIKCATLESQGLISRRDLNEAYKTLAVPPVSAHTYSDDRIVGLYQARTTDSSPAVIENLRKAVHTIGTSRNSSVLTNAAKDSVETYDEAINWLGNGATKDSPDEYLLTAYAIKIADNPGSEELGRQAIRVIANQRSSHHLGHWLRSGNSNSTVMSPEEALRHLNVDMPIHQLDQTMLPMMFEVARSDRPGEQTEKAIQALQEALRNYSTSNNLTSENWPVGLISHGNTCYLNSILQYYYSIKPLRDIVLEYDKYKLDVTTTQEKEERVGQRMIELAEIKGGQLFAEDLKELFVLMNKSPESAVKPEQDLVCRAFLDPKDSHLYHGTRAVANPTNESDATVDVARPVENEQKIEDGKNEEMTSSKDEDLMQMDSPTEMAEPDRKPSTTSEATLNEDNQQDVPMQSTEMPPTPPASPGAKAQAESDQAPPLPPRLKLRKFSTTTQTALNKAEENAKMQQDVTEVHDSVMFRLRAGMTPLGADENGEQQDPLRSLFSFTIAETIVNEGINSKPTEIPDSSIQLNVPYEATDIYSALDAVFDLQTVREGETIEQYKSMQSVPPILQVNIPRIGFSKATNEAFKSDKCMKLEDTLYLDRYHDSSSDDTLARRERCWGWRKRLHALEKEKKTLTQAQQTTSIDGPVATEESAKYLEGLPAIDEELSAAGISPITADSDLPSILSKDSAEQSTRLTALQSEAVDLINKLSTAFADLQNLKYRLHAVFFHRGGTGHGHYWLYIRDFKTNTWRKYNDEHVDEFKTLEDIYEAKTWNQGTPTYAVYVKDELKEQLVEPVCRAPEKTEGGGGDATMGGNAQQEDGDMPALVEVEDDTVMNGTEQQQTPAGSYGQREQDYTQW